MSGPVPAAGVPSEPDSNGGIFSLGQRTLEGLLHAPQAIHESMSPLARIERLFKTVSDDTDVELSNLLREPKWQLRAFEYALGQLPDEGPLLRIEDLVRDKASRVDRILTALEQSGGIRDRTTVRWNSIVNETKQMLSDLVYSAQSAATAQNRDVPLSLVPAMVGPLLQRENLQDVLIESMKNVFQAHSLRVGANGGEPSLQQIFSNPVGLISGSEIEKKWGIVEAAFVFGEQEWARRAGDISVLEQVPCKEQWLGECVIPISVLSHTKLEAFSAIEALSQRLKLVTTPRLVELDIDERSPTYSKVTDDRTTFDFSEVERALQTPEILSSLMRRSQKPND